MPMIRGLLALLAGLAAAISTRAADEITAKEIVAKAHAAAGGEAWLRATTNTMSGVATLHRGGLHASKVVADRYVMNRVYPKDLQDAHQGSGKFRLEAHRGDRLLFLSAFDGQTSYDQNGPIPRERARTDEANAYGFGAIRFALEPGFTLDRLADDDVEGHLAYFVRVGDPSGSNTVFGIDQKDFSIRSVGWNSPRGWHHRIYSDFYRLEGSGFQQPGRVRLYYSGVKEVDILWKKAAIGEPLPDDVFVVKPSSAKPTEK